MEVYHRIAKQTIIEALNLPRYSGGDKELVIKQLGDYLKMSVRSIEMLKMNISWAFITNRDNESPITFKQFRVPEKDCKVALKVLLYGTETGITIYEMWGEKENYLFIDGDNKSLADLCDCGDWDCEICSEQDGLATLLLVGR